jgi:hypothetical protein
MLLLPDIEGVENKFPKRRKSSRSTADFDTAFVKKLICTGNGVSIEYTSVSLRQPTTTTLHGESIEI